MPKDLDDIVEEGEEREEENETLENEIMAINSIYGEDTIRHMNNNRKKDCMTSSTPTPNKSKNNSKDVYILHLPHQDIWLKIQFSQGYPLCSDYDDEHLPPPISVLGTHGCGPLIRKGDATRLCSEFQRLATHLYRPGEVYLFDIMEEMSHFSTETSSLTNHTKPSSINDDDEKTLSVVEEDGKKKKAEINNSSNSTPKKHAPEWVISDPIRELKSLFLAHCTLIYSTDDIAKFRTLLLNQEKKLSSATHNIMAWRIRFLTTNPFYEKNSSPCTSNSNTKIARCHNNKASIKVIDSLSRYTIEEDYDDDGENAAGARLLHLMQLMDVWNVLVIVSRWYGGINLGPRRFAIINSVARDALLKVATLTPRS